MPRFSPDNAACGAACWSVEAVDKTGAGDAFAGGLGVGLLEHRPPIEAVRFAVASSTVAVTRYGSQPSYPDRQELERFLEAHSLG
jgi:ribokinase